MTDKEKLSAVRANIEKRKESLKPHGGQGLVVTRLMRELCDDFLSFIDSMQEETVSKDYRERYKNIAQSDDFKSAYENKSLGEVMSVEGEEPVSIWHDASEKPNIKEKSGIFVITSLNGEYIGSRYYNHNDITITLGNYDKWAYIDDILNLSNVERTEKDRKEPVSEDLKDEIKSWLDEGLPNEEELVEYIKETACHFAKWQEKQDQSTIELAEDHAMLAGMEKMKEQMMKEPNLSGYVARDEDGNLHIFEVKPRRLEEKHRWWDRDYNCHIIDNDAFPDLRWKDEPICVKLIIIKED
jgi:hypothetical protein